MLGCLIWCFCILNVKHHNCFFLLRVHLKFLTWGVTCVNINLTQAVWEYLIWAAEMLVAWPLRKRMPECKQPAGLWSISVLSQLIEADTNNWGSQRQHACWYRYWWKSRRQRLILTLIRRWLRQYAAVILFDEVNPGNCLYPLLISLFMVNLYWLKIRRCRRIVLNDSQDLLG